MKIILILLDGLGDRAYKELDHCTPLQAAATPHLDRLAAAGSNGLFHASTPGECLPSEIAHYLLFGYDLKDFPGRGLMEAIGDGVTFQREDVLCLAHLCMIEWLNGVAVLKCGRSDISGTREALGRVYGLIERFEQNKIRIRLQQTRRNDAILILSGPVSARISDSDPMRRGSPVARIQPLDTASPQQAAGTAAALNAYLKHSYDILSDRDKNPFWSRIAANFLVTQRCGRQRPQTPFQDLWGLRGALIASPSVYAGLARVIGLDFIQAVDTASPGDDLRTRIAQAVADSDHDFVHVHTKAPDEAAHKKDPLRKRDIIAQLDQGLDDLIETLRERDDILVAITADHSTPSGSSLIHSGEPVPLLICGPNVRKDGVGKYNEIEAACGCLGMLRGSELMAMLLNYANRSAFHSHRLGAIDHHYVPSDYEAFRRD